MQGITPSGPKPRLSAPPLTVLQRLIQCPVLGTLKEKEDADTKLFRVKTAVEGKAELLPSMDMEGHSNHFVDVPVLNQPQSIMAY